MSSVFRYEALGLDKIRFSVGDAGWKVATALSEAFEPGGSNLFLDLCLLQRRSVSLIYCRTEAEPGEDA